jgi:hypothetical protein
LWPLGDESCGYTVHFRATYFIIVRLKLLATTVNGVEIKLVVAQIQNKPFN